MVLIPQTIFLNKHKTLNCMKKILSALAIIAFLIGGTCVNAQKAKNEVVKIKDGKMLIQKNGKWVPMPADMTMGDGTQVSTTGTVTMKNGSTMTLANGYGMTLAGGLT